MYSEAEDNREDPCLTQGPVPWDVPSVETEDLDQEKQACPLQPPNAPVVAFPGTCESRQQRKTIFLYLIFQVKNRKVFFKCIPLDPEIPFKEVESKNLTVQVLKGSYTET